MGRVLMLLYLNPNITYRGYAMLIGKAGSWWCSQYGDSSSLGSGLGMELKCRADTSSIYGFEYKTAPEQYHECLAILAELTWGGS